MKTVVVFTEDKATATYAVDGGTPHPLRDGEVKLLSVDPSLTLRWGESEDPSHLGERQFTLAGDGDANLVVRGDGHAHAERGGDGDGDVHREGRGAGNADRTGGGEGISARSRQGGGDARYEDEHGRLVGTPDVVVCSVPAEPPVTGMVMPT